jgi:hypothetical protein
VAQLAEHLDLDRLQATLAHLRAAPADRGVLELIVRRPAVDEREVVEQATLDLLEGLLGDTWRVRPSRFTPDGSANPDAQLTLMNVRVAALVAGAPERIPLAGDQLYVDLDLSVANLPAGSRLALGEAVVEITAPPHTGCAKFQARFGNDALRFVNSPEGRALRLRGANAKVIVPGAVRRGDEVRKANP